jgi:hypothetical protein
VLPFDDTGCKVRLSAMQFVSFFAAALVLTFACTFVAVVLVELPFAHLVKHLFEVRKTTPKQAEASAAPTTLAADVTHARTTAVGAAALPPLGPAGEAVPYSRFPAPGRGSAGLPRPMERRGGSALSEKAALMSN